MTTPARADGRLASLDGPHRLASLMVVFTHVRLATEASGPAPTSQEILDGWLRGGFLVAVGDGATAVAIFFVLSGVVLVLPFLRRSSVPRWLAYYPRRLVRIYLPVWASIALGFAWFVLVPRRSDPSLPWWIADHQPNLGRGALFRAFTLIQSTNLNTPLWSLHWEIIFSLALPLFVLVVLPRHRSWPWIVVAAAFALVLAGSITGSGEMLYLPQFLVGAVLASRLAVVRERLGNATLRVKIALGLLVVAAFLVAPLLDGLAVWAPWPWALRMIAATGAVLVFLTYARARRLAETRVVQWLGRISFSLYLVHEPLVVSLRLLHAFDYWTVLLVALPASLALAHLFYVVVERPAHKLSRRVGEAVLTWSTARLARSAA